MKTVRRKGAEQVLCGFFYIVVLYNEFNKDPVLYRGKEAGCTIARPTLHSTLVQGGNIAVDVQHGVTFPSTTLRYQHPDIQERQTSLLLGFNIASQFGVGHIVELQRGADERLIMAFSAFRSCDE
ncbi:hypothetical protein CHS0354_012422 [Potamilus streckersoni]|uniref:Uncharacterized protein n=1 Tax=Potamilus streckersoni TaxID=2493646 RepID=A0AAE0SG21_9BIVA|nr:hypothetical protein CHS0354_012422 [Potamilus streckersoni]